MAGQAEDLKKGETVKKILKRHNSDGLYINTSIKDSFINFFQL